MLNIPLYLQKDGSVEPMSACEFGGRRMEDHQEIDEILVLDDTVYSGSSLLL